MELMTVATIAAFAPLAGAALAGFLGWKLGRGFAHTVTIASVAISLAASLVLLKEVAAGHSFSGALYTWLAGSGWSIHVGFLVDRLTAVMMVVVTFVSLMVHVYTIGYMARRRGLPALLLLHLALHLLDADAGDGGQLPAALLRLGGGRPRLLPAHRLLVPRRPTADLRRRRPSS